MKAEDMERIHFFKMTGSGNDFILVDNRDQKLNAAKSRDLIRLACRRKLSVGADGFIFIENDPEVDFRWQFFNSDGSEAEMCGNGARCAARFAFLQGIVNKRQIAFRTLAGVIEAEITGDRVKIRVSPPHGLQMNFPVEVNGNVFDLYSVNTGVPHVVHFLKSEKELEEVDVLRWGSAFRYHQRFQPAGTNANFAVVQDTHRMAVRTYERGVEAETLACGTGSVASALLAAASREVRSPVEVKTRSGEILTIYFDQVIRDDTVEFTDVFLAGDAKVVYEADLWDETLIN
ncbi:MAG: diaminopimelate epimerase [Desulforhabdus sp.]|jgi:diaminopimelate epimerase|nr:diaminopimelate epimerase [Desulforhabdus sp.]